MPDGSSECELARISYALQSSTWYSPTHTAWLRRRLTQLQHASCKETDTSVRQRRATGVVSPIETARCAAAPEPERGQEQKQDPADGVGACLSSEPNRARGTRRRGGRGFVAPTFGFRASVAPLGVQESVGAWGLHARETIAKPLLEQPLLAFVRHQRDGPSQVGPFVAEV